ncbi:MAG: class I SAM-dependent methyltransferase [Oscillospiraceae bacterium]|jgi:hypothetical protein|nr:class I SAM-dependent methyltransferase [Oscillospiraceae bacterium]
MREIRRILKPGGFFINALYTNETLDNFSHTEFGYKRYTSNDLIIAGQNVGFVVEIIAAFSGKAYCAVYRRED